MVAKIRVLAHKKRKRVLCLPFEDMRPVHPKPKSYDCAISNPRSTKNHHRAEEFAGTYG